MRRLGPAALAATIACATAGEPAMAPPPPSFAQVRTILLVRTADSRAGRPKDPLDGLDESLRARGYVTRVVELGARPGGEEAALARLFAQLESRAAAPRGDRLGGDPFGDAGQGAGEAVAALGVDAVASYHRLDGRHAYPAAPREPASPGLFPGSAPLTPVLRGPMGALALVDRAGHVATFAWGEQTALEDPAVPVNAAEAIDLLVSTLAGEPLER